MFSISQLLVNYWNLPFKEYSSLLIGLTIYSIMYVYLLYSNTELLTILNKSIIFIFIIDFGLTYFIYGYNKNKTKIENIKNKTEESINDTCKSINETEESTVEKNIDEELNKELEDCFASSETNTCETTDTESEFTDKIEDVEIE